MRDKSILNSFLYLEIILISVVVIYFASSIIFSIFIKEYHNDLKNKNLYLLTKTEKINEDIAKIKSLIYTSALRRGFDYKENIRIKTLSKKINKEIQELEDFLFEKKDKELETIIITLKSYFNKFYIIGKDLSKDFRKGYDDGMDGLGAIDILEINMSKEINKFNRKILDRIKDKNDYIYDNSQNSVVFFFAIGIIAVALSLNVYFRLQKLRKLNNILDKKVTKKNKKLKRFNSYLKYKVKSEVNNSRQKDKIIFKELKYAYVSEMLSMIAHQWRQPLSLISTASGHIYILNQFDNITPDELSKQLGIIQDATQKLSNIIEDFKTFFQPNTKKSDENIKSVIDDAIYFMSVSFSDNNIKVENNLAQLDTKIVSIYKNNIIQVVTNLLKNSIEAMEFEEVKKIKISNKIDDGNYIITIEDSGCGIAFDISDKVFEPYFSTKSKNERGLGLYMCKTIIEDYHQGKIYFENVGQGVRFILKLPIVS